MVVASQRKMKTEKERQRLRCKRRVSRKKEWKKIEKLAFKNQKEEKNNEKNHKKGLIETAAKREKIGKETSQIESIKTR